jgi:hypothetical protein
VPVLAEAEERDVEDGRAQLVGRKHVHQLGIVLGTCGVGAERRGHRMHLIGRDAHPRDQRLIDHSCVCVGIVQVDHALVTEPQVDPGPIDDQAGERVVAVAGGVASGERKVDGGGLPAAAGDEFSQDPGGRDGRLDGIPGDDQPGHGGLPSGRIADPVILALHATKDSALRTIKLNWTLR